jgi:hypothetical protein
MLRSVTQHSAGKYRVEEPAMKSPESQMISRRSLLSTAAASAGVLAVGLPRPAFAADAADSSLSPVADVASLAMLRNYRAGRFSSWDRTGGNNDSVSEKQPGDVITIADLKGPGQITHIWIALVLGEDTSPNFLKEIVLRAFWDGEENPSVESPLGDFFGLTLGTYFTYQSALTNVSPAYAMNCYFPMPFNRSARLTLVNEGPAKVDNYYFNIDYVSFDQPLKDVGYFHAQYRQEAPCHGWASNWKSEYDPEINDKKNLDGKDNYLILEAEGRGHFVGVTQGVLQNQDEWFGEGDEMIFIDDSPAPAINGTGTEDYYNGSTDFRGPAGKTQTYSYPQIGAPFIENGERVGGRYCLYRWHLEGPIPFRKNIRVTMEHGHANHRSDNFYTVAYWYQTEPHRKFLPMAKADDRVPRVYAVGGPGIFPAPK